MTRTIGMLVGLFSMLLLTSIAARPAFAGTDLDVFAAGLSVQPNVMIEFDNSGSMNSAPPYDPGTTYTGTYNTPTLGSPLVTAETSALAEGDGVFAVGTGDGASLFPFAGKIMEMGRTNGPLSGGDSTLLNSYLATKYGSLI